MKSIVPTWADLQSRLKALIKGVPVPEGQAIPAERVEVVPVSGGWRWRAVTRSDNLANPGERYQRRGVASKAAIVHGSAFLPVYRRERDGSWAFLRAPLLTGFGK